MTSPLISIVVPCYNAEQFISQTLNSIIIQEGVNFEIIIVDDGSTDRSKEIIGSFKDRRINYLHQKNQGVSMARNKGLAEAQGEYIIFFDADDIMTRDFLSGRFNYLEHHSDVDFICGRVQKFNEHGFIHGYFRGTSLNIVNEILLYHDEVTTCPSNYLFRREFLINNDLSFNCVLSSTADRFFLIKCAKYGKVHFSENLAKLNYRIAENSMSYKLTPNLVRDNELFYKELVKSNLIPESIQNKSLFLGNFILAASYFKLRNINKTLKYAGRSFFRNPIGFVKKL